VPSPGTERLVLGVACDIKAIRITADLEHVIRGGHRPQAVLARVLGDPLRPMNRALRAQPSKHRMRRPVREVDPIADTQLLERRLILVCSTHDLPFTVAARQPRTGRFSRWWEAQVVAGQAALALQPADPAAQREIKLKGHRQLDQVGEEVLDALGDVVPDFADLAYRLPLWVFQTPVDVALPRDKGTRVAATHRHNHVGLLGQLARE